MVPIRSALAAVLLLGHSVLSGGDPPHPRVFRTFMPGAGPSAFAVELSPSLALCYDPLRGGVVEVWQGRIDLSPTLRAKINEPATVVGEVFHTSPAVHPLRLGDPAAPAEHRFRGYRYEDGSVVFEFTLRGHTVTETLRAEGGGLVRELAFPAGAGPAFLTLESSETATIEVAGGEEVGPGQWRFPEGGRATVRILPKRSPQP